VARTLAGLAALLSVGTFAQTDGFVEVKFKPLAGRENQAGGVVWRWKDGDTCYVARANWRTTGWPTTRTRRRPRCRCWWPCPAQRPP
jgi:hypothetical protein